MPCLGYSVDDLVSYEWRQVEGCVSVLEGVGVGCCEGVNTCSLWY